MTAEVAILNRQGAVLAADSAVTIGGPEGKVYNTATKILPLFKSPPIVLMVYNAASFEGIPWKGLVHGYQSQPEASPQDTVEQYARSFIDYLEQVITDLPRGRELEREPSGLVFVGFGRKQWFPALSLFAVNGTSDNTLQSYERSPITIDWNNPTHVEAYAQIDMFTSFTTGLHPNYKDEVVQWMNTSLTLLADFARQQYGSSLDSDQQDSLTRTLDELKSSLIHTFRYVLEGNLSVHLRSQIESMVEWAPLEELARMAEDLVNLQSMRLRATASNETVGGPVDVLAITKGDGLNWIKHKTKEAER